MAYVCVFKPQVIQANHMIVLPLVGGRNIFQQLQAVLLTAVHKTAPVGYFSKVTSAHTIFEDWLKQNGYELDPLKTLSS